MSGRRVTGYWDRVERADEQCARKHREREQYITQLATAHAERTGLPLATAREHVTRLSVFANLPRIDDDAASFVSPSFQRFG